jgi:hypothetical protein
MRTYTPTYMAPAVDVGKDWAGGGGPNFTIYSPDPYDLPIYSLPIPVDYHHEYSISVTYVADIAVTAGFKLLIWFGETPAETLPGATRFRASTLAVRNLDVTEAIFTTTFFPSTSQEDWARVVCEVDTCTASIPGVTATISQISLFDKG